MTSCQPYPQTSPVRVRDQAFSVNLGRAQFSVQSVSCYFMSIKRAIHFKKFLFYLIFMTLRVLGSWVLYKLDDFGLLWAPVTQLNGANQKVIEINKMKIHFWKSMTLNTYCLFSLRAASLTSKKTFTLLAFQYCRHKASTGSAETHGSNKV